MRKIWCIHRRATLFAVVAEITLSCGAAKAFVLNGNRWPGSHPRIPYYVSTNLQGNVPYDGSATFETVVEHIRNAAEVWNAQGATNAEFVFAGTTPVSQIADDGINAVVFDDGACPIPGCLGGYAAYHQSNGVFRGIDIVFYKYRYGGVRVQWKTQLTYPTQSDVWTTVLHEFGHAFGMDHSQLVGVVMGCLGPGTFRRSLYADDIAGVRSLYGTYSTEGFWSNAATVEPGESFTLHLDYPRAAGRKFGLYFNAEASGATHMPLPDSRVLPLASPYANARDFPDIFLNPTCLYGGQCQGMFGTLDANGRATVTVQLPADGLTSLGPDLYLAAVTRNTAMPSGYEDISVGVHVQILGPPPCTSDAECDDGNPCTDDFCDAGSCSNPAYDCDDDDACTTDHCQDGWCISEPLVCNDNNACTIDSCNPATGCLNAALACNDGDTCTTDSCEPALGSVYTPIAGCITCRAIGQSCTANSDCCSGSCKGRTGLCN